jgi:hypothetical protein
MPYKGVFEMVHHNMRETRLSLAICAGSRTRDMWGWDDVLNIVHDKPSPRSPHTFSAMEL